MAGLWATGLEGLLRLDRARRRRLSWASHRRNTVVLNILCLLATLYVTAAAGNG
jgi:hypothetical protein